jgi:hypothetical protein
MGQARPRDRPHFEAGMNRHLKNLDQEIRDHIERETLANIDRGMPPADARAAALRAFGNITRTTEQTREVWSLVWLEQPWQDIRYGIRMLVRNPGFTALRLEIDGNGRSRIGHRNGSEDVYYILTLQIPGWCSCIISDACYEDCWVVAKARSSKRERGLSAEKCVCPLFLPVSPPLFPLFPRPEYGPGSTRRARRGMQ